MNIFHIVGARPNFMKVAPVLSALKERTNVVQTLIHTGQHYDVNMSDVFFQQLGIPAPDRESGGRFGHACEADCRDHDAAWNRSCSNASRTWSSCTGM